MIIQEQKGQDWNLVLCSRPAVPIFAYHLPSAYCCVFSWVLLGPPRFKGKNYGHRFPSRATQRKMFAVLRGPLVTRR